MAPGAFDPTAYATRRKAAVEKAQALREQRRASSDQEAATKPRAGSWAANKTLQGGAAAAAGVDYTWEQSEEPPDKGSSRSAVKAPAKQPLNASSPNTSVRRASTGTSGIPPQKALALLRSKHPKLGSKIAPPYSEGARHPASFDANPPPPRAAPRGAAGAGNRDSRPRGENGGVDLPTASQRSQTRAPPQERPAWQSVGEGEDESGAEAVGELIACRDCGRTFSEEALTRHAKVCKKVFCAKRRVFNMTAQRVAGTEAAKFVKVTTASTSQAGGARGASSSAGNGSAAFGAPPGRPQRSGTVDAIPLKKLPAWKNQSEALRQALQMSKKMAQMTAAGMDISKLPPPPPSVNPDYVPCPYCTRRFAPQTAERHIPHCKNTINKPKPVPTKANASTLRRPAPPSRAQPLSRR